MLLRRLITAANLVVGLLGAVAPAQAAEEPGAEHLSRWSLGLGIGRSSLEVRLDPSEPLCFRGCILPEIAPSLLADASIGFAAARYLTLRASVSPALQQELQFSVCWTGATPDCSSDPPQRRWLEYRVAAEVHGPRPLAPFAGLALGGAAYPMPEDGDAQHRLIWDVRAGVEAGRRVAARIEVSRTHHGNPPWDWQGMEEGFVDWQVRVGVRLQLRRSN